jgi:transposase|tara:strand:+ start:490 stop:1485 length:996 start_codon:yes stop_codon:yes gene_type:complete
MKTNEIIGIDVSKLLIDVCIYSKQIVEQFENNKSGFKSMLKWVFKNSSFSKEETMFIFEHTGMYSHLLSVFLTEQKTSFFIASGLEIKRSIGIARGKDDQIDAKRIAQYGYRLKEELKPSNLPNSNILQLKSLLSLRTKLNKQRAGFKVTLKEQKRIYKAKEYKIIFDVQQKMIVELTKQINKINTQMQSIIDQDISLKETYKLVTSVKGIGMQTAIMIIVFTDNFSKFENWRKFASYCGIAPFPYQSGTSIKGRTKVSHLANKKLKAIINMCAISAIQHNPEMKVYYQKRVEQGKSKMSTVNIIRNKLIARVFAVVKRQTPYVDILKYAA